MDGQDFFDERQGAAVIKHGILRRYLPIFAGKTGSTSESGRVVYLDGYAGAGVYESGEPGSPILAVETARKLAGTRALECFMIERNRANYLKLCTNLAGANAPSVIQRGTIHDELDHFLAMAGTSPPALISSRPRVQRQRGSGWPDPRSSAGRRSRRLIVQPDPRPKQPVPDQPQLRRTAASASVLFRPDSQGCVPPVRASSLCSA